MSRRSIQIDSSCRMLIEMMNARYMDLVMEKHVMECAAIETQRNRRARDGHRRKKLNRLMSLAENNFRIWYRSGPSNTIEYRMKLLKLASAI